MPYNHSTTPMHSPDMPRHAEPHERSGSYWRKLEFASMAMRLGTCRFSTIRSTNAFSCTVPWGWAKRTWTACGKWSVWTSFSTACCAAISTKKKVGGWLRWRLIASILRHRLLNPQSPGRAFQVGERHYDIGNDVFQAMLDPTMSYSCAYWAKADNLADAQRHKLELICRKLELQPGERLLDIGCGWGGLAHHAATHHGVNVVGVTVSRQQLEYARKQCADLPVQFEFQDYRKLEGSFDKTVSVGMFEHVGPKNYPAYFDTVHRMLADQGLFLLHTIGDYTTTRATDPWMEKYVFPNGKLPSARQLTEVLERRFVIEDWHNFGPDYDRTLMAWWANFDAGWPRLRNRYDSRFYRMWKYYLLSCAGFFGRGKDNFGNWC